ncbi:tetratricopeptide repeat protein [Ornithinibacillus californiensis]|uniref:tetratricopeptide repeat protein n=1 Tax=Ornithinibacillus californiensis TaxID=161536 RepID=UPI001F237D44|nr:tetratricopeptide repeat protein [Ornithinibacillus californiensis]
MQKGTYMSISVNELTDSKENQQVWGGSQIEFSPEVLEIEKEIKETPSNPDLWMKKGLALSKSWQFREAIDAYSIALSYDPFHALVYRHRGHRFVSVGMYKEAAADFELSSRIDATNWDTWYHLGLAYYLLGDYERAENAYKRCLELTKSDELYVAIADWFWMTLKRLGKDQEAEKLLIPISESTDPGENISYLRRLQLYKGMISSEELLSFDDAAHPDLELATQGYGLGVYYLVNNEKEKAFELFHRIVKESTMWSAFGYLAAEAELNNGKE